MSKVIYKGKTIRLYPNKVQEEVLKSIFDGVRFVWNQMLEMQNTRYANCKEAKFIKAYGMNYLLPCLKIEYPWLKDIDSIALQNENKHLETAFINFWKHGKRHPRFKSKRKEQSYTTSIVGNNIRVVDAHHIRLPKVGTVYFRSSSLPAGKLKSATIRKKASGKYIASLLFETEVEEFPRTDKSCGCDLGLKELAILDDGTRFPIHRFDKALESNLKYWQRLASRRLLRAKEVIKQDPTKDLFDFKNYQKAKRMVAKYHEKISNQRLDTLHKVTTWMVQNYDVIVLEDLKSKFMLKNHKVARAISNAGWNRFINMLRYKCEWYGKKFIQVDAAYTSQTCHVCGCLNNRMGYDRYGWLKVREWTCSECGTLNDRDVNAAINIKEKGLALI